MDLFTAWPMSLTGGLPRASGDGPCHGVPDDAIERAAPRERGWTPNVRAGRVEGTGCPARAGMDPGTTTMRVTISGLPRASGDGPLVSACRLVMS